MTNKLAGGLMLLGLLTTAPAQAIPVVYFDFDGDSLMDNSASFALGDSFSVGLYASDIDGNHQGLLSWGTEIGFDSTLVSATAYTIDSSWPLAGINNGIDNGAGSIELLSSSFVGYTGTVKLADIQFDTLAVGNATLSLTELFSGNLSFDGFVAADGYSYDTEVVFNDASISVSAVPIPGSLLLLLSGAAGMLCFRRRSGT